MLSAPVILRRYLREVAAGPRLARPSKLDSYKDYLLERTPMPHGGTGFWW